MTLDLVPIVVQKDDLPQTIKLKAPTNTTVAQFLQRIRGRLQLPVMQSYHLVCENGSPAAMSQSVGSVFQENGNHSGLLHFTCVTENAFGCPMPPKKPVKSVFPEEMEEEDVLEPLGPGAHPASSWYYFSDEESVSDTEPSSDTEPAAQEQPLLGDLEAYFNYMGALNNALHPTPTPPAGAPALVTITEISQHPDDDQEPPAPML